MIRRWVIAGLVICGACGFGGRMVTIDDFYSVSVGASRTELVEALGKPYNTRVCVNGWEEIEYIERLKAGDRLLEERCYIYTLEGGIVIARRIERRSPGPWRFDSYEMQTTQNEEEKLP